MNVEKHPLWMALACALAIPAQASDDVDAIREELKQLREQYEERLQRLEQRLLAAESDAATRAPTQQASVPVSAGRGQVSNNSFNPAISAIIQTKLSQYSEASSEQDIAGFQVGGEGGRPPEGFSLDETEITVSANVDPMFYGEATIGLHEDEGETEIDIEEAYFDTLALPGGFALRGGRFYSGIGYLNRLHTHAWDFHDAPLPYQAFLGGQYGDDGVRLSWLAPSDLYLNLGAEILQGNAFPGGESDADFGDSRSLFAQVGGDIGISHSWRLGLSGLWMDAHDRAGGGHAHGDEGGGSFFTGDSDLLIGDFVYKWAPNGNPRYRNFMFLTEYFQRDEDGQAVFSEDGAEALLGYQGRQRGFYMQGVYQFMPRWRVGVRYDWLDTDNRLVLLDNGGLDADEVLEESGLLDGSDNPDRWSLMADYSPSEFSRLRLQYNQDNSHGKTDRQWTLQYIMSLGAHGAHEY